MKKMIALVSSLFVFVGIKAQTPTIKKETIKPSSMKPRLEVDSAKAIKTGTVIKQTDKAIKFDKAIKVADKGSKAEHIKKTNADIPFKQSVAKPIKK